MRALSAIILTTNVLMTFFYGINTAHADTLITLTYAYEEYGLTHKALINELRFHVNSRFNDDSLPHNRKGFFESALVDLNNDGVDEMLVVPYSATWCGMSSSTCDVSVYRVIDGRWDYLGVVAARWFADEYHITIEDHFHQGWRTMNDGKYRYCWVKNPPDKLLPGDKDQFFMPHISGQPGYFWSVSMDKKCPDR